MSSPVLAAVLNHLWQSTLFAGVAACLTLLMGRSSARLRYLAWLAASLKFLVPFAWLSALGALIPWPAGPVQAADVPMAGQVVQSIMMPGGHGADPAGPAHAAGSGSTLLIVLAALWLAGAAGVAVRWLHRWRALRRALLASAATSFPFVIPVRRCAAQLEPAVVGVLRPVLLLPDGLERRLAPAELAAVLAHERCHVVWRDNLAAAVHMLVEALCWFHPLTWWLGARLLAERERACDEQVLAEGHAPSEYAEGILKVCEHFLHSSVPCAAGVGGASLKHRIEDIMKNRLVERLGGLRKACVIIVAGGAVAAPVAVGLLTAPRAHAQAAAPEAGAPVFSDVSIQLAAADGTRPVSFLFHPDGTGFAVDIENASLQALIASAYNVQDSLIFGRQWSAEPRYNITMKSSSGPGPAASAALRDLLGSRFGLVVTHQLRQVNGYVLMVGSGGPKLKAAQLAPGTQRHMMVQRAGPPSQGGFNGYEVANLPLDALVNGFAMTLHAPVIDETGLQGDYAYSYKVSWEPGSPPDPALLDSSLLAQLGLHLEARPVNVDTINVVSLKPAQEVVAQR